MKKFTILFTMVFLATLTCQCQDRKQDKKEIKFLVEMADARMMDREEGRLAAQLGSTQEIRDYGNYMVKDQTMLLEELKKVTAAKNITLPAAISEEKSKALSKLKDKRGAEFDKKFLKMIKLDHKRDVRKFTKATAFEDVAISDFAKKYLPTIETHLSAVQKIMVNL